MDSSAEFKEIRIKIEPELTQVYVLIECHDNHFVHGWHHKTFPASISAVDILKTFAGKDSPMLWNKGAP